MVEADASSGATTIAVTSGKGGVGKTSLATNLAIGLGQRGSRVCLLDADMGLANVNILLGVQPRHTLDDLMAGHAELNDLIIEGPDGLHILPAAAGLERLAAHDPSAETGLARMLTSLEQRYDYLLVDTPAGIGATTKAFVHPCDLATLVVTPEPTSLTDAFTLLRALLREGFPGQVSVVVNMLPPQKDGHRLFDRFRAAAEKYLNVDLDYLGAVPMDRSATQAVLNQTPLLLSAPEAPASGAIEVLAGRVISRFPPASGQNRFADAWQRAACEPAPAPTAAVTTLTSASSRPSEVPGVVTTPEEMREAASWELEDIGQIAERLLADEALNERQARRFFARIERSFSSRYRRRADDVKGLLYESLLQEHLGEDQLREIRDIVTETYARRFPGCAGEAQPAPQPPDHPTPDNAADWLDALFAAPEWNEARSRALLEHMNELHRRHFDTGRITPDPELKALSERFLTVRRELQNRLTEAGLLMEEHARLLGTPGGDRDHSGEDDR